MWAACRRAPEFAQGQAGRRCQTTGSGAESRNRRLSHALSHALSRTSQGAGRIPREHKKIITVDRLPLIDALRRAQLMSSETRGVHAIAEVERIPSHRTIQSAALPSPPRSPDDRRLPGRCSPGPPLLA